MNRSDSGRRTVARCLGEGGSGLLVYARYRDVEDKFRVGFGICGMISIGV